MSIRFINGGPWDGIEFDATVAPGAINFQDMDVTFELTDDPNVEIMRSSRRPHQYVLDHR
jgi:hypothetical protein